MSASCRLCPALAVKQCPCKLAAYCGPAHHAADWNSRVGHRNECTMRAAKCVDCGSQAHVRATPIADALEHPVCSSVCGSRHPYAYFARDKCPLDATVAAALDKCMVTQEPNGVWRINAALIQGKSNEERTEEFKKPGGKRQAAGGLPVINSLIAQVADARGSYENARRAEDAAQQRVQQAESDLRAAARLATSKKQELSQAIDTQQTELLTLLQQSSQLGDLTVSQFKTIMEVLPIGACVRALAGGKSPATTTYRDIARGTVEFDWVKTHSAAWLAARTAEEIDRYFHTVYDGSQVNNWDHAMMMIISKKASLAETPVQLALAVALQFAWMASWKAVYPRETYDTTWVQDSDEWYANNLRRVLRHPGLAQVPTLDAARQLVPELAVGNRMRDAVWPPRFVLAAAIHGDAALAKAVVALPFISVTDRMKRADKTGMELALLFHNPGATAVFASDGGGANSLDEQALTTIASDVRALPALEEYFKHSTRVKSDLFASTVRRALRFLRAVDSMRLYSQAVLGVDINLADSSDPMLQTLVGQQKWRKVQWWVDSGALRATTPWQGELFATYLAENEYYDQLQHMLEAMDPADTYDTARHESPVARALLENDTDALKLYARYGHFKMINVPMRTRDGQLTRTDLFAVVLGGKAAKIMNRVLKGGKDDLVNMPTAAPAAAELK